MGRAVLALALPALLAGCVGPIDPPDGGDGGGLWADDAFSLGAPGPDGGGFAPFPAEAEGSPGAQGGFHVSVAYQVTGEGTAGVRFEHRVRRTSDGTLVSKGSRTWDVLGPTWVNPGPVIIFMCPTPVGVNVINEPLAFEVTASGRDGGLLGKATGSAVFRCPAGDAFCFSICSG